MRAPGKAAYADLENDPDLEFSLYLADRLGKTLKEIGDMPHAEYMLWSRYWARRWQERELAAQRMG